MPDSHGDVVTRVDPTTVRLQVRFWDDTPGDKTISRGDFTLKNSEATFLPFTGRSGCDAWPPQTIRIDGSVSNLTLCFTVLQADNVDLRQLFLVWSRSGDVAEISLGKTCPSGSTEINITPSPLESPSPRVCVS
jgi:hypothetical protein